MFQVSMSSKQGLRKTELRKMETFYLLFLMEEPLEAF